MNVFFRNFGANDKFWEKKSYDFQVQCLPYVFFGVLPYLYVHTNDSLHAALHGVRGRVHMPWTRAFIRGDHWNGLSIFDSIHLTVLFSSLLVLTWSVSVSLKGLVKYQGTFWARSINPTGFVRDLPTWCIVAPGGGARPGFRVMLHRKGHFFSSECPNSGLIFTVKCPSLDPVFREVP